MKNRIAHSLIIVLTFISGIVFSQNDHYVVLTADQPNVWTLEQAHYLLAQMHRRNLDLKATGLENLNPNEIHGLNIDVLKTLLQVSAEYDQAKGLNNAILKDQRTFNADRRMSLLDRRAKLQDEYSQLTRQKAQLQIQANQTPDETEKEQIAASINEIDIVQAAITQQVQQIDTELAANPAATGDFQSATPSTGTFSAAELNGASQSAFDTAIGKALESFANAPKLNASMRLENYLQMQYEILSKQLTLLRDEVGPGERLIFLEMPQSIRSTYDKADKKWAQSWWKIRAYTACKESEKRSTSGEVADRRDLDGGCSSLLGDSYSTAELIQTLTQDSSAQGKYDVVDLDPDEAKKIPEGPLKTLFDKIEDETTGARGIEERMFPSLENREARIVDLFPRQSSLNVNEIKQRTHSMSLRFVFTLLTGIGGDAAYKRSREQYSQFVQQELYSAGFGKGGREFGWTFFPMPGTKRVASGTRTTYAIMVVPKRANSILLQSTGCYYDRSEKQIESFRQALSFDREEKLRKKGRCSEPRTFIVPIPTAVAGQNVFWVERMDYSPVEPGGRITVSIRGRDFSTQTGILVDGVPLRPSLGLGQPFILDDSLAARSVTETGPIKGTFERVASDQIIATFEMGAAYKNKTPQITLIAPGKALLLNSQDIRVNKDFVGFERAPYMFGSGAPSDNNPSITSSALLKNGENLTAMIHGKNLHKITSVYGNGVVCTGLENANSPFLKCDLPKDESTSTITLTLVSSATVVQSSPIANPFAKKEAAAEQIKHEANPAFKTQPGKLVSIRRKPNTANDYILTFEITGTGFTPETRAEKGRFVFESETSGRLIIESTDFYEVFNLLKDKEKEKATLFLPAPKELAKRTR